MDTNKSEFFHFGILPQVCIHSLVQDEYSCMYSPQANCECGSSEWIDSTMEIVNGLPIKDVHRCKHCNKVRLATHIGYKE